MDNKLVDVEDYFCCGNCINYMTFSRSCEKLKKSVTADCVCTEEYEFDGMSRTERMNEAFEQNNC